jgi:hypothetical protein
VIEGIRLEPRELCVRDGFANDRDDPDANRDGVQRPDRFGVARCGEHRQREHHSPERLGLIEPEQVPSRL